MMVLVVLSAIVYITRSDGGRYTGKPTVSPIETPSPQLGSAGNEYATRLIARDGVSFGGAPLYGAGKRFQNGTSTVCNLISPSSTSTLAAPMNFVLTKNATTTAKILFVATSTVDYATTSPLWSQAIPANQQTTVFIPLSTSTASTADNNLTNSTSTISGIFAPNTRVVFSLKGGTSAAGSSDRNEVDGYCNALWLASF